MEMKWIAVFVLQIAELLKVSIALPLSESSTFLKRSHVILLNTKVYTHKAESLKPELAPPVPESSNSYCKTKWDNKTNEGGFPSVIKEAVLQNDADKKHCEPVERYVYYIKMGRYHEKYQQFFYRLVVRRVTVAWKLRYRIYDLKKLPST